MNFSDFDVLLAWQNRSNSGLQYTHGCELSASFFNINLPERGVALVW